MPKLIRKNNDYIITDLNLSKVDKFALEQGEEYEVNVAIVDKRLISQSQRNFIFALCSDISSFTGYEKEWVRNELETQYASVTGFERESLSICSMSYANGLIRAIIDYCIFNDVPLTKKTLVDNNYSFDEKQSYALALKRRCVICGGYADIHHVDAVGNGNNRNKIDHKGKRALPLCRKHHTQCHELGNDVFIEYYHLTPFVIDEKMEKFIKRGYLEAYEK